MMQNANFCKDQCVQIYLPSLSSVGSSSVGSSAASASFSLSCSSSTSISSGSSKTISWIDFPGKFNYHKQNETFLSKKIALHAIQAMIYTTHRFPCVKFFFISSATFTLEQQMIEHMTYYELN